MRSIYIFLLLTGTAVSGQQNFIRTITPKSSDTSNFRVSSGGFSTVLEETQYVDGLGRPLQTIVRNAALATGSDPVDLVNMYSYDKNGRQPHLYLPFPASDATGAFKSNAGQQQNAFYSRNYSGENYYYAETVYENSPLDRIEKKMAVGINGVGSNRGISTIHDLNTSGDSVRIWNVKDSTGKWASYSSPGMYGEETLFKSVITNEQGKITIEFKDKSDHVVLRKEQLTGSSTGHTGWLCTYFVYDPFGRLRLIIQPTGVNLLQSNNWNINALNSAILHEQCFRYEYDGKNRMIRKKQPGAAEIWMVYDNRDRLVMTQTAGMRSAGKWAYFIYDNINREIETGLWADSNPLNYHTSRADTSGSYPSMATKEILTTTHYDNTDGMPAELDVYNVFLESTLGFSSEEHVDNSIVLNDLTGMPVYRTYRIIGTNNFIKERFFYLENGRLYQSYQLNDLLNSTQLNTTYYNFTGQTIRAISNTTFNNRSNNLWLKLTYDNLLRPSGVYSGDTQGFSVTYNLISALSYDSLGRIARKNIGNMEKQDYTYNIINRLTTINKGFLKGDSINFFGQELAYDNSSSVTGQPYAAQLYNGNIAGTTWKSAGDNDLRRYDFTYDNTDRLTAANFTQKASNGTWNNATLDFTTRTAYDANGNIQAMLQKGWKAGSTITLDSLTYTYSPYSNKLLNVLDNANDPNTALGDFRSSNNYLAALGGTKTTGAVDYVFDSSANLISDKNKDITRISYNHLNLPEKIVFAAKGEIRYTYNALGQKLQKLIIDSTVTPVKKDTTTYINGYIYKGSRFESVAIAEEGKKMIDTLSGNYYYHFYVKDNNRNVRSVITTSKDTMRYIATMEAAYRAKEQQIFYNIETTSYPSASVPGGYPADNTTSPNDSVVKLNGSLNKIGPAILLHVMAGDTINLGVKYFYRPNAAPGSTPPVLSDILASLATGFTNLAGASKGSFAELSGNASPLIGALTSLLTTRDSTGTTKPRAYLSYVAFDERFQFVNESSGIARVGAADALGVLTGETVIKKNGYIYVYLSNETENWNVFFDNLTVQHRTGPLVAETHYYPFGLTIEPISAKAFGKINNIEFSTKEKQEGELTGASLEWYDFSARMYDPQIGRFFTPDPNAESYPFVTPYNYAFNNPILISDPTGKDGIVTGSGTKEDPYVVTANYYYYNVSDAAEAAIKAAESKYNSEEARAIETSNGTVYVKFNIKTEKAANAEEAEQKADNAKVDVNGTTYYYGNTITSGTISGERSKDWIGEANRTSIILDEDKIMKSANQANIPFEEVATSVVIHEIGHTIGGVHNDPGNIMLPFIYNDYGMPGFMRNTVNMADVDKNGIRAIIGRVGLPNSNVESKYLTPRERKQIKATARTGVLENPNPKKENQ